MNEFMSDSTGPQSSQPQTNKPQPVVIQTVQESKRGRGWWSRFLLIALVMSVMFNFSMYAAYEQYFADPSKPVEHFRSGDQMAEQKIAVIEVTGTIMPPYTERIVKSIKHAGEDEAVKGVLLVVDSPGGLVADSHQIYHRLKQLSEKKPVYVALQRLAASGGYYIAMGAGPQAKIFAEPTTWTGSIGVIIPRFDVQKLAEKLGVESVPLKTGEFKDALSPFRDLTDEERTVWKSIMDDSFQRFVGVIAENRANLNADDVKKLATGRIFTSDEAVENKLIDEIGYDDDAIEQLKSQLGLEKVRVVEYQHQPNFMEMLAGGAQTQAPGELLRTALETIVPRAMYFASW